MPEVTPRFEFRAFAQSFGVVEDTIRRLAKCETIQESYEVYIVQAGELERNVKIRDNKLDIKQLINVHDGFEQWRPAAQHQFPIKQQELHEVLPELAAGLDNPEYDQAEFLRAAVNPAGGFFRANVFKRRFRFHVEGCPTEIDDILINGTAIRSVAIELEDATMVSTVRQLVRLDEHENVSFPLILARTLGLKSHPDEDRYG